MPGYNSNNQNKISPEFAARLTYLEPQQKVRVIVLLQVRQSKKAEALADISPIIQRFDGLQLAEYPDLLGSIPVEITTEGINALAESDVVKAVIEDQAIFPGYSNNAY